MTKKFRRIVFVHVPRSQNILANSLASLSSSYSFPLHQDQETIILQRLHMPPKISGLQRPQKMSKNRMRIQMGVLLRLFLYWNLMKNLKKNFHDSIISSHTFKTERTPNQLLLTNGVRYVAWLTNISLSGVRSSGEDSTANFSDVSQTKKLIKL